MATKYAPRHRHRRVLPLRFLPAICALCLLLGFLLGRGVQALSVGDPLSAETMGADAKDWVRPEGACLTSGTLILVSNEVPFSFPEEQALCTVLEEKNDCYLVRDSTVQLAPEAMEALNQWMEDFLAQGGSKTVNVVAGHRTEAFQQHLFDQSADRNGLEHAQHYVALPGRSEHPTGYALDLSLYFSDGTSADFDGTGSYAWLAQHAADYGFVLRYPADKESVTGISYESWHYRYVGRPHARVMADRGLCLEEYLDLLRQYSKDAPLSVTDDGRAYQVYFCPENDPLVPAGNAYTLSGNNVDGFLVTLLS